MSYTIQQLATLSGVSVRALHHYDNIGLLRPTRNEKNGYREYRERELLLLQQILFFRELDFALPEIAKILASPNFDMEQALREQRNLIALKKKRLSGLLHAIDKTIMKLHKTTTMDDKELYSALGAEEVARYAEEAKARWGNTDAYTTSQARLKKMTKADMDRIKKDGHELMLEIVASMKSGPESAATQMLIAKHYAALRTWYEPNLALYRGLADMYIADPRFSAFYEKYATGLAQFMHDAMYAYAKAGEQ